MDEMIKRAREYLRVSADSSGTMESPEQQHHVNEQHAERNGWTLGEPYAENGAISASRYSKKRRAGFERLLADLEGDTFGAEILILWESSRGSRRVGEWVRLIEACEDAHVLIYVTSHGRAYDPADDRDRRSLLEDAVDSEYESAKISKRVRRTKASHAEQGRPHGQAAYGFKHLFDPRSGRLTARVEEPAEAVNIRELFDRLYNGHTLRAIEIDFEERGIRGRPRVDRKKVAAEVARLTAEGTPPDEEQLQAIREQFTRPGVVFTAEHLRPLALNPAYAGLRTHQPTGTKRRVDSLEGAVKATWPGLVSEEIFYAVHARLTSPERRHSRPGGTKHELTLIAGCGECGGPLTVRYQRGARVYTCRERSCLRVPADELDQYAATVVLAYLARPANYAQLTATPDSGPELARVRSELGRARDDLGEWRRRAGRREVSAESFAAIEPGILGDIGRLEDEERRMSAPAPLAWLLGPAEDLVARWADAPVSARRDAYRLLCSPRYLGILKACRSPVPGHRVPIAERVRWDRESAGVARFDNGH
jgi:DNA invertase Pin-like site-specific DNA recombinase